jgi:hypothetical protein
MLDCTKDVLDILDLSYNNFSGAIPSEFGDFDGATIIYLGNNSADM